jgi:uncharacterized membrane protein (DUF485 family)
VLVWATRSVLRVLIGAHRLIWGDRAATRRSRRRWRAQAPRPAPAYGVVTTTAGAIRHWAPGPGVLATLFALVFYAGLWLLVSVRLPHHGTRWTALIPGALLFGIGIEVLQVVIAYLITPYAVAKQGTYARWEPRLRCSSPCS